MPFHIQAYHLVTGAADVLVDTAAVQDSVFSQRNNHFIYSEPYNLLGVAAMSPQLADVRLNMPSINAVGFHHAWPLNLTPAPQAVPSPPRIQDLRSSRFSIPDNEEMSWLETSNSGIGPFPFSLFQWIADPTWNMNLRQGVQRLTLLATAAPTNAIGFWSGLNNIVFEQTPRGGWYSVNAAYLFNTSGSACKAFRLFFPRAPTVAGRIMRPGHIANGALGDNEPYELPKDEMGEWGMFHTFEPPLLETYGDVTNGIAQVSLRLDVTYLGTNPSYTIGQNV